MLVGYKDYSDVAGTTRTLIEQVHETNLHPDSLSWFRSISMTTFRMRIAHLKSLLQPKLPVEQQEALDDRT